jgi:hypothetical protein
MRIACRHQLNNEPFPENSNLGGGRTSASAGASKRRNDTPIFQYILIPIVRLHLPLSFQGMHIAEASPMIAIESSPQRLLLRSGSTSILLDKAAGTAVLQRKLLFWARKPLERQISSITQARVNTDVDPASKAEICSTMLILREGGGWTLSARDKQDATAAAAAVREFLGLPAA